VSVATIPILPTYARQDITFVRGEGCWVEDSDGNRYLDFVAGIAVVGLGHCHPAPLAAAEAQLQDLWHVSNLYWTEPMVALAGRLAARFPGGASAFFCNSGAEAVEAALKWARKTTGRPGLVALDGSFHGRTMGALAITGQPAKRAAFEPLIGAVSFARLNDVASLEALVGDDTAAIVFEPIQGEGGVHPVSAEFAAAARRLADEHGALLVADEVQTGVGRTGSFFAFEQLDVRPDAVTLAKGLANGLPIGALLVADEAPQGFEPGDHASTFGGNAVSCAAANAVCDEITDELLEHVRELEDVLAAGLAGVPGVLEVRGRGLLLAAELDRPAWPVVEACRERGLLVLVAGENVLRLTPPLTVTRDEAELALATIREVLTP
jgi:predicted acetylornithine/succinylornithine family transaminase